MKKNKNKKDTRIYVFSVFSIITFLSETVGRLRIVWLSNKRVCFVQAHVPRGQSDCERPGSHRHVLTAPRVRPDRPSQVSQPHPTFYPFTSLRPSFLDTVSSLFFSPTTFTFHAEEL